MIRNRFFANGYEYIFKWTKEYEPKRTDSVAEQAKRLNCHPMEVLYDWLCEEGKDQKCYLQFSKPLLLKFRWKTSGFFSLHELS